MYLGTTYFLDVILNLRNGKYHRYRKVNNELFHIHKQSNHPPSFTKEITAMISKKIFSIFCDKDCFDKAAPAYHNALKTAMKMLNSHRHHLKDENAD